MALNIRRGASRVFQITLENCEALDYLWSDLGTIRVRLSQGDVYVDKIAIIDPNDATACLVYYSQAETLKFSDKYKAKLQVFVLNESQSHQLAIKSSVFDVIVSESLWNEYVTDGNYGENESLILDSPEYQEPIGHDYYSYLHIDINEYRGIISEVAVAVLDGDTLVYNPDTEVLYSESLNV